MCWGGDRLTIQRLKSRSIKTNLSRGLFRQIMWTESLLTNTEYIVNCNCQRKQKPSTWWVLVKHVMQQHAITINGKHWKQFHIRQNSYYYSQSALEARGNPNQVESSNGKTKKNNIWPFRLHRQRHNEYEETFFVHRRNDDENAVARSLCSCSPPVSTWLTHLFSNKTHRVTSQQQLLAHSMAAIRRRLLLIFHLWFSLILVVCLLFSRSFIVKVK